MSKKKYVQVIHASNNEVLLNSVLWCESSLCKFRGLQFRQNLDDGEGLILVHKRDSIAATSIHMFFVFFPIAAIWINLEGKVTHKVIAKPWHPYYVSPEPASYVLEAKPKILDEVAVGERLRFEEI